MTYLDYAATAPVRREVLEAMWPYLTSEFGNPASVHEVGRRAAVALEEARSRVAAVLGCRSADVIFTSGGTESNNSALFGLLQGGAAEKRELVTSPAEHEAILETAQGLAAAGVSVRLCEVDADARVSVAALEAALTPSTGLVSLMYVNNEVGTVNDIAALAAVAHARGALFHTDAVQAAGLPLHGLGVDALSLSGHKLGTPYGIGVVQVSSRCGFTPLLRGGGQERGRRSGTVNVAGAVGMAVALELSQAEVPEVGARDEFIERVLQVPGAVLTGSPVQRAPGHASFCFSGVSGEAVLLEVERRGVVASSGSACAAGRDEPSHVLLACGFDADVARTAVRISWGAGVTRERLRSAAEVVVAAVAAVRG